MAPVRGELAARAAEKIGQRAGILAVVTDNARPNPFASKGLDDLAEAWQRGYDRAVHPSSGPYGYRSS